MVTGGGSGGHITPILAIAAEIKKSNSATKIVYIGQKGDKLGDVPKSDPNIDNTYLISAGKFRRYHGEGWRQLFDLKTQYLNFRDVFRVIMGIWQSWRLLGKIRPSVVFTRGGFVSVPVAVAAKLRGIPYITHDSDSTASLANRLIAPMATKRAVALSTDLYPYPRKNTVTVGVPISDKYDVVSANKMKVFREQLGISKYKWVVCATGGGNGAVQLNKIILDNADYLLRKVPDLVLLHIAGRGLAEDLKEEYSKILDKNCLKRVIIKEFVNDLYVYSGAADIVIARGGATNLAEFSAQAKPCIIIPSKQLSWNVANARALAAKNAIIELSEEHAEQERRLASIVIELLEDIKRRKILATNFAQFSSPNATKDLVELILSVAKTKKR